MSTQGGLKHVATEPAQLDNKRERRRGAAGRAAALRRAPSDSDCSGETASLSADSGDRVRPIPPPARTAKSRSRRRGSEWEVLEGLKDGQRYDRRPEVFNGYLHKKRKWPLKGWHKRFFVIDGGILVYARSPTDVARGRLHGSVDVGLSVISAKARRRRIDIDADEFIYHLRAKTPDVFRTWLNVLKVHRLYRQHLLTFGARESVPKIHAPLDDLPQAEVSSRTSLSNKSSVPPSRDCLFLSFTTENPKTPKEFSQKILCYHTASLHLTNKEEIDELIKNDNSYGDITNSETENCPYLLENWNKLNSDSELMPLEFEQLDDELNTNIVNRSLCSMNCMAKMYNNDLKVINKNKIIDTSNTKNQIHYTELDQESLTPNDPGENSSLLYEYTYGSPLQSTSKSSKHKTNFLNTRSFFLDRKNHAATALYLFSKSKRSRHNTLSNTVMKKSKKCTNLVKYRNLIDEPTLKKPLSRNMLLGQNKTKVCKQSNASTEASSASRNISDGIQVNLNFTASKSFQDEMTASEFDKISEKLMFTIINNHKAKYPCNSALSETYYIKKIVKDLYEVKLNRPESHPVKALFRSLLEYWLRNTAIERIKEATQNIKSIDTQSLKGFTKDEQLSSMFTAKPSKSIQCMRYVTKSDTNKRNKPRLKMNKVSESFEKERRIQELERMLKNTVYICETGCSNQSKEEDIKITKKLIDNLEKLSKLGSNSNDSEKKSDSSTEFPKIQETINHLISQTSITTVVAKEFLGAYLDVLLHDNNKTSRSKSHSSVSSEESKSFKDEEDLECYVQTETISKKVSKSLTATFDKKPEQIQCDKYYSKKLSPHKNESNKLTEDKTQSVDPGQLYLKDILDKITSLFSKVTKSNSASWNVNDEITPEIKENDIKVEVEQEYSRYPGKNLITENHADSAVVIDLSKYKLERISMFNDPMLKGMMSITINLKETPSNFVDGMITNLSLKFVDETATKIISEKHKIDDYAKDYLHTDYGSKKDMIDRKPFVSSSDATSKGYFKVTHESAHSLDLTLQSSHSYMNTTESKKSLRNDDQSCYVISTLKSSLAAKFHSKKKVKAKDKSGGTIITPVTNTSEYNTSIYNVAVDKPKIIDEKFILLLLENLTLLSQTIPPLHKEIAGLYNKLRKRHEKLLKNCPQSGLGLLGKIYSDEAKISMSEVETQSEKKLTAIGAEVTDDCSKKYNECGVVTSASELLKKYTCVDECLSAYVIPKIIHDCGMQTVFIEPEPPKLKCADETCYFKKLINGKISQDIVISDRPVIARTISMLSAPSIEEVNIDRCTSAKCQNGKNECDFTTAIECIFDSLDSDKNFKFKRPKEPKKKYTIEKETRNVIVRDLEFIDKNLQMIDKEISKKVKNDKRQAHKLRQNLIKEIKLLSPSFKVSTQSQTDKIIRIAKERKLLEKDFNVYQLFYSSQYRSKDTTKSNSVSNANFCVDKSDDLRTIYRCSSDPSYCSGLVSPTSPPLRGPQAGFVAGTPGGRLASWIIESGGPLENVSRELGQAQLSVQQLQRLLEALELQQQLHHDTDVSLEGASPNVKKDRRKFGLRKKKSNSKCASVELAPPHIDASSSHSALSALTAPPSPGGGSSSVPNSAASLPIACAAARPQSLPGAESLGPAAGPTSLTSLTPDQQLREDFTVLAKDLLATLKGVVSTLVCERSRLRTAMEAAETTASPSGAVVAALRTNLTSALQQNSELRSRLSRIHDTSDLAEVSSVNNTDPVIRQFAQSLSYSSSCVSASEFFDAEEHDEDLKTTEIIPVDEAGVIELDGDSTSDAGSLSSEEGSASSDNSDGAMVSAETETLRLSESGLENTLASGVWTRRGRLPCPRPTPGGPSLWNLLYKNIGKDLSQVSMPVTINEPLNMLQRLCEELEYSELLESAASCAHPVERMSLVAAFAVSAYAASAHRAASKPFNPLLAETYECIRTDRRFKFLAEQVSHHPPISACHAESPNWVFWQEARIKTKFWGKSMEFQPAGRVHVRLLTTGCHYSWNKVTTCVHNLFGGQRWVDQYGDMIIINHGTDITCKLNFVKASSWSSSRHDIRGWVTGGGAKVRISGRWSEAVYAGERCLWRPGAMPPDNELYYGFTRFAMELNEIEPGTKDVLPYTDTRLRPDQRALEEGDVEAAEKFKHDLEQAQRDRRRDSLEHTPAWFRKVYEDGEETWVFTGEYWSARDAGFPRLSAPRVW